MVDIVISGERKDDGTVDIVHTEKTDEAREVLLTGLRIDDEVVRQVVEVAPGVEKLVVRETEDESLDTALFSPLESLEMVSVYWCRQMRTIDLGALAELPGLKQFFINTKDMPMKSIDLSPLAGSKSIEWIKVEGPPRPRDLMLRSVDISGLGKCPGLRYLYISNMNTTSFDLSALSGAPSLKELYFLDIGTFWAGRSEPQFVVLPECENLETLYVAGLDRLCALDLSPLADSPLKTLDLHGSGLYTTDPSELDLSPLAGIKTLQRVVLSENTIYELDITPLMGCEALTELELDQGTRVYMSKEYRSRAFSDDWPLRECLLENEVIFY